MSIAGIVGLVASTIAIGLWIAEQLTGQLLFEDLTIPVKLVVLAAPLFFLSDLSARLHHRPRLALALGFTFIALTMVCMASYLPWRSAFAAHFNNEVYRWYYVGSVANDADLAVWQASWKHHGPHLIEAGLLILYATSMISACVFWRLDRVAGAFVAGIGYLLLLCGPLITGLIVWDYDTFLKGIAFDSISMDLMPPYFWHAGDYSIFLYVFMLIFFAVCVAFMWFTAGKEANQALQTTPMTHSEI